MKTHRKKDDRQKGEKKLDQAIEMTFPASDPIAVASPTSTEEPMRPAVARSAPGGKRDSGKRFTVGLKLKGKVDHVLVDAEDALIAALKIKTEHPDALIMYVRPRNRRGDARHPPQARSKPSGN